MRAVRRFVNRLASWTKTKHNEERLRLEIEEHLELQTAENIHAGFSPPEARRLAMLKFGTVEMIKENYRDQRGLPFLETLFRDTRHAFRRLRKAPAFTTTTILTLALGIGATTSIFTLVYAVLLQSLAVPDPGQLYKLGKEARCCYFGGYSQEKEFSLVSYDLYKQFRDNTNGFAEMAAFEANSRLFGVRPSGGSEAAQSYPGEFVSGNYFTMFGLRASAGRLLGAEDDKPGVPLVAVMSYRLWQQRYGLDPSVIGSIFNIDNKPFTVVGVTPPRFFGDTLRDTPPDFFLPLNTEPSVEGDADLNKPDTHWLHIIGRIRPSAAPSSLEAEMRVELKQWLRSHWSAMSPNDRANLPNQTLFLTPGGAGITSMREQYEHWLRILTLVSGFVLLIVCCNVAYLMLVRGMERRRQTSLSMALGAGTSRVVRQALTESILLSFLGGAAGLAVAFATTRIILHFAFPAADGLQGIPISAWPSMPVLLFAFCLSLITGIAFGIAPAWMDTRVDPIEALRGASRSTPRTSSIPRNSLVVLQAAISLILLSAAGLLTTALHRLETQDLGFELDRRFALNIEPRLAGYRSDQLTTLYQSIHDSLMSIPAISSVALCTYSPQYGVKWGSQIWIDGHPDSRPNDYHLAAWNRVTAGYFEVIGNPIIRGRGISAQDTAASRHVAVINDAFARKFFGNEDPIGKHFGRLGREASRQYEIVGIAKDIRNLTYSLDRAGDPYYFLPEAQHDVSPQAGFKEVSPGSHFLHDIAISTRPGANLSFAQVRQAMAAVDPNLPVLSIRSLKEGVAGSFKQQRLMARLTSFFGILSLVLASIGLYGLTAYNAGLRTSEIGVRMALGAKRSQVLALVLRGSFALIVFGLLLGLPLTLAVGRLLGSQLYGINPYSPAVTLMAVATLSLTGLAATLIPALRASLVSPLEALRAE